MEHALGSFAESAKIVTQFVALGIDLCAVFVIGYAALRSIAQYLAAMLRGREQAPIGAIRLRLGRSLILGLEFLIGADILRTSTAPSWTIIGQLAAIILLRTLMDYLLERELARISAQEKRPVEPG